MLKPMWALTLLLCATGCAKEGSLEALCDHTVADREEHAAHLAEDAGDQSVVSGALLIRKIDIACGS